MKKLLPILGLVGLILFINSCEPREEVADPIADFTYSPAEIKVGDIVTFTNASIDYTDVLWDFGDGSNTSEVPNPTHIYEEEGTYNVTLIAENKGKKDDETKTIVVEANFEPTEYDGGDNASFEQIYSIDFADGPGEWEDKTVEGEYEKYWWEEYGIYTFIVYSESGYNFSTNSFDTPDDDVNYDIDVYIYAYDGSAGYYWGSDLNTSSYGKYQYIINDTGTDFESYVGYYDGDWTNWISGNSNHTIYDEFNLLTIRKYKDEVYVFMNENYIGSYDWDGKFGDKFGFYVSGGETVAFVSSIAVHEITSGTKKAAGIKDFDGLSNHDLSPGTSIVKASKSDIQVQ